MKGVERSERSLGWMAAVAVVCGSGAFGAESDKWRYHLLNPTPKEQMRDMATDRPDVTESPITVDAGHYQIEMDLIGITYDRDTSGAANTRTLSYTAPSINLKAGLFNNVDLQFVIEPYNWERVEDRVAGTLSRNSGFGDMQTRLKVNLWGNDGGRTALAVMPWVKWPTAATSLGNGSVEGGVIVPFGFGLPHDWEVGMMAEFDIIRNAVGGGHHLEVVNTVAVGHDIVGDLGGYLEFISVASAESGADWAGVVAAGVTFGLNENTQLDAGVNVGIVEAADDVRPFVGLSWRF